MINPAATIPVPTGKNGTPTLSDDADPTIPHSTGVTMSVHRANVRDRSRPQHPTATPSARDLSELTPREHEILTLVAQGLSDRGIGRRLWLTRSTVETHIRHVLTKLDLPSDVEHNRRVLAAVAYLTSATG
jgi:DNA-binding NarL/FixJ family response regulator